MYSKLKGNIIMLLFLCYYFIQNFIILVIIERFPFLTGDITTLNIINQLTMFLIPIGIYIIIKKRDIRELFAINTLGLKNILFIVIITFLLQPVTMVINGVITLFYPNFAADYVSSMTNSPLWYMILSIAVMPAICEELMFRGVIFSEFRNENKTMVLLFPALYFGIMHLTINQFFYATFLGIVFAYFIIKTKSIFAGMVAHFVLNASQVVMLHFVTEIPGAEAIEEIPINGLVQVSSAVIAIIFWSVVAGILSPILYILIKKFNNLNKKNQDSPIFRTPMKNIDTAFELAGEEDIIEGPAAEGTFVYKGNDTDDTGFGVLLPQQEILATQKSKSKEDFWFIITFIVICLIFISITTLTNTIS
ncbi:MAG: CPBP family intramembrane metalloprotease [Clostridiales bacterium]|jgi:membrane protease YdiL (CAAX protease family)|nr:CPBP family intramembrane metalloprotease [Clostridiales bacterium]